MTTPRTSKVSPTKPILIDSQRGKDMLAVLESWDMDTSDKTHIGRATRLAVQERAAKLDALDESLR